MARRTLINVSCCLLRKVKIFLWIVFDPTQKNQKKCVVEKLKKKKKKKKKSDTLPLTRADLLARGCDIPTCFNNYLSRFINDVLIWNVLCKVLFFSQG